jgi:hypothetical protein
MIGALAILYLPHHLICLLPSRPAARHRLERRTAGESLARGGIAFAIALSYFIRETGTALIHRKAGDDSLVETTTLVIGSVK